MSLLPWTLCFGRSYKASVTALNRSTFEAHTTTHELPQPSHLAGILLLKQPNMLRHPALSHKGNKIGGRVAEQTGLFEIATLRGTAMDT